MHLNSVQNKNGEHPLGVYPSDFHPEVTLGRFVHQAAPIVVVVVSSSSSSSTATTVERGPSWLTRHNKVMATMKWSPSLQDVGPTSMVPSPATNSRLATMTRHNNILATMKWSPSLQDVTTGVLTL